MAKRTSNGGAGPLIVARQPFTNSKGSMRGVEGAPPSLGRLVNNNQFRDQIAQHKPDYTVMSYQTPIAYHHEGGWEYPDHSYSSTTSRHQAITRGAIGVKSARDKMLEERNAKRAAKQSTAKEDKLWQS
jgi:hypothetical protein